MKHKVDATLDKSDPGDETQNRIRYQHAYGVLILAGGVRGDIDLVSLYCEHHEDYVLKTRSGRFWAYQVKTQEPELGRWSLRDPQFYRAIGRFVGLEKEWGSDFEGYTFVSNVAFKPDSKTEKKRTVSPIVLWRAVAISDGLDNLNEEVRGMLAALAEQCERTDELGLLFKTIRKTKLVLGPEKDGVFSVVAHEHLAALTECRNLNATELNTSLNHLIGMVERASSRANEGPARHWLPRFIDDPENPTIAGKVILISDFLEGLMADMRPFRYASGFDTVELLRNRGKMPRLEAKLRAGKADKYIETFKRRALSAERRLLELPYRSTTDATEVLNQLDSVVLGICDDAHIQASAAQDPFGVLMLQAVQKELKMVASGQPSLVYGEPYECLFGYSGLLTEECRVWWSHPFDMEDVDGR